MKDESAPSPRFASGVIIVVSAVLITAWIVPRVTAWVDQGGAERAVANK